jgi:FkbM family methyltransferase
VGKEALVLATKKAVAWDWAKFAGSEPALKYARRDLPTIDKALKLFSGRTACVQAGACLGVFPKYLARLFTTVYTFEPSLDLFPLLLQNAPEPNILKYQAALGWLHEPIATSQTRRGLKAHRFPHEGITHISGPGVVPTLNIDDLGLPVCDFLCLDLEGFEYDAIRGATQTIDACRPVIMLEVNDNSELYGHTIDELRALVIDRHRYKLVFREHSDEVYVPMEAA